MAFFKKPFCLLAATLFCFVARAQEVEPTIYPTTDGTVLSSSVYGPDGSLQCKYHITVHDCKGDLNEGSIEMTYKCFDKNGKPLIDGSNEFTMKIIRSGGKVVAEMESMQKLLKIQNIMPAGDASSLPVDMKVGQILPDSHIDVRVGKIKVSLDISDKKVLDHKKITTPAGTFDAFLVHEKSTTKTPFSTEVKVADSWYAVGLNTVRQTVWDEKGNKLNSSELTSVAIN